MRKGYEVDHDDLDLSIKTAEAFLPTTHMVIARSELVRLTSIAKSTGEAEQARRYWPDVKKAYANGRAAGIDLTLRALRYRWVFVAAVAVISFVTGRQSILWQAGL